MKILIAPDKFKGTLSAREVCRAIAQGLSNTDHEIKQRPLADGGEGTQELFLNHWNGKRVTVSVHDPLMRPCNTEYILSGDRKSAFIEMASASGLELLKENERNPMKTTTYGTGEIVLHALEADVENIILGIGGSATNDAGLGLLSAIGFCFLNEYDEEFIPRGQSIQDIKKIDSKFMHPRARRVNFTAICDVLNPFYGEQGAAHVYARQKGATQEQIQILDRGLQHVANMIKQLTEIDVQQIAGSGAGGGIAGGLHALLKTHLKSGIDVVFELTRFDEAIQWADVVITGEGKVDEQTWQGKVVSGVVNRCVALKKKIIIVCGQSTHQTNTQIPIYSVSQEFGLEHSLKNPATALEAIAGKILKSVQ